MKKLLQEFKDFINRGNAMDMAVGVIVGGAFTAIVTSLTNDILSPFLSLITGNASAGVPGLQIEVPGGDPINFSAFISAIINFLIIAFVVFLLVKGLNKMSEMGKSIVKKNKDGEEEVVVMNPPTCPFCLEEVKEGATRCPHCGGEFKEPAKATPAK